ncbi:hypothetical protein CRI85_04200 [Leuconostoc pseudomesenteroides]|uniref:Uncharacterized protein n=1 Tax=Leuconostoc litchii TaxID=1981069 RepID=A0A6P2CRV3_9LACO|nr:MULTISPECIES: hypothetical protein [Leuconostoc]MCC8439545.1 hypothetical protein [Leuconostoc pseudomesenteroides]MDI6666671.1 hypothetical protein [Leuconostoc falkenbergense]TYC46979.1 hypothetical protein ESZ47_02215 [Leuconostoc litchii]GMA68891.1 hypothetical protein GCM10025879_01370 [Leuconostoc litchii]
MTKQFYDDFSKLPIAKMAQSIADMTYLFNETKVPTSHYKAQLSKGFEEMVEASVSVSLVNTIFNTLQALQKESPKLFYQAMLCLDTKVKPSSITPSQYQAMEFTWSQFELNKKKNILDKDFIQMFNQVEENGLTYYTKNQQEADDNE